MTCDPNFLHLNEDSEPCHIVGQKFLNLDHGYCCSVIPTLLKYLFKHCTQLTFWTLRERHVGTVGSGTYITLLYGERFMQRVHSLSNESRAMCIYASNLLRDMLQSTRSWVLNGYWRNVLGINSQFSVMAFIEVT